MTRSGLRSGVRARRWKTRPEGETKAFDNPLKRVGTKHLDPLYQCSRGPQHAHALAERMGESVDEAVVKALRERLARIRRRTKGSRRRGRLLAIGMECAALPDFDMLRQMRSSGSRTDVVKAIPAADQ